MIEPQSAKLDTETIQRQIQDLNRALVVAFTPVLESLVAFARRLEELGLVDQVLALTDLDQQALDDTPDGCWADVWDDDEDDYLPCNAGHVDELGLCPDHATQLRTLGG